MNTKNCIKCKRPFPEYMVGKYPNVFLKPICPLCGLSITNKMFRRQKGTPFKDPDSQEVYQECLDYVKEYHIQNMGGYMINPPEDCPNLRNPVTGGTWVDLARCNTCQIYCNRFNNFKRMSNEIRRKELKDNGVLLF